MKRLATFSASSLGRKIYMGLTGLLLSVFIVLHLLGNLALLNPDRDPLNKYADFLYRLGAKLYLAEFLLAAVLLVHLVYALIITWSNWRARPIRYSMSTAAGSPSRKTIASSTMIYSGLMIMVFLILHIRQFKFSETVMYATADGYYIRDMYAVIHLYFSHFRNVLLYVAVMVALGFHLSHGFWSAFQSLGISSYTFTRAIYIAGYAFAVVMAFGFLIIPVLIFFKGGGP